MKGKEIIALIKEYELEEFDVRIYLFEKDNSEYGASLRKFEIDNVPFDISYSEKIALLNISEK